MAAVQSTWKNANHETIAALNADGSANASVIVPPGSVFASSTAASTSSGSRAGAGVQDPYGRRNNTRTASGRLGAIGEDVNVVSPDAASDLDECPPAAVPNYQGVIKPANGLAFDSLFNWMKGYPCLVCASNPCVCLLADDMAADYQQSFNPFKMNLIKLSSGGVNTNSDVPLIRRDDIPPPPGLGESPASSAGNAGVRAGNAGVHGQQDVDVAPASHAGVHGQQYVDVAPVTATPEKLTGESSGTLRLPRVNSNLEPVTQTNNTNVPNSAEPASGVPDSLERNPTYLDKYCMVSGSTELNQFEEINQWKVCTAEISKYTITSSLNREL